MSRQADKPGAGAIRLKTIVVRHIHAEQMRLRTETS